VSAFQPTASGTSAANADTFMRESSRVFLEDT